MTDYGRDHADTALDERVSALLSAAAAPSEPGPLPGEAAAMAAFRASLTPTRRRSMISSFLKARTGLVAAVGAGLLLTGGVTTAAAGGLPGAAQDTADQVLERLGIQVSGPAEAAGDNAATRGNSEALTDEVTDPADDVVAPIEDIDAGDAAAEDALDDQGTDGAATDNSGKGEEVSSLATSTEAEGVEKGAAVSTVASEGKSKAGQNGKAGQEHGKSADSAGPAPAADAGQAKAGTAKAGAKTSDDDADESADADDETGEAPSAERRQGGARS